MTRQQATPDTTDYRQRTLDWLDITVPFEMLTLHRLRPQQRIALAQDAWQPVLECAPTGRTKTETFSGGAALMYGGPTYELERNRIRVALAAMAYQPGGITWMGRHWCTNHQRCLDAEQAAAEGRPWADANPDEPDDEQPTYMGRPITTITLPGVL